MIACGVEARDMESSDENVAGSGRSLDPEI
jgi:hypothetical protein